MTTTLALRAERTLRLDYGLLRRVFVGFAFVCALICPMSPDPVAFALGAFVPWLIFSIIGTPTMPAPVGFFLFWQWLQTFTRVIVGQVDGEPMARSLFGPAVEDAYWFMMASIIVLALAFRAVLGRTWPPTERDWTAHLRWRPVDAFLVYLASVGLTIVSAYSINVVPALYQQFDTLAKFKFAALYLLFGLVLSLGRGYGFVLAAVGLEIAMGFTGLLGEFRGAFIVLVVAAIGIRLRMTPLLLASGSAMLVLLLVLGLFWTAVKTDYRNFATGSDESQAIAVDFQDRLGFIGQRAATVSDIDWNDASYALLVRLAYVDIFGSVVGVMNARVEDTSMRQWGEAWSHVFQPRFLFPDKAILSDTEVYLRLTRADPTEMVRLSTSISVGYMGENYADLGFPKMLLGIFAIGIMMAAVVRYFMATALPWLVREATVMAFIVTTGYNGVEVSLPKIFGATVMFFAVYAIAVRFGYPIGLRWLDNRANNARQQVSNAERAADASRSQRP